MARLVKTKQFQMKKTRSLLKRRDTAKLAVVAKKKVTNKFRQKFAPDYKDMSPQQRIVIDQKVQQKFGAKIAKVVKKLNSVKGLTDTFIKTKNGFKVTNPEGYVAIDRVSGGAVKLVDRMEFSFNNFTAIKSWDK